MRAGTASRIPASRFHAAFNGSPAIRHAVQIHLGAMLIQFQLGAACNALHPVKARMARWLLHLRDCVDHDVLPLTQDALSQILGVQRTTVTVLMRNLRASGTIRSDRRGQIEIDRSRLAAAACECHDAGMRLEVDHIFSTNTARSGALAHGGRCSSWIGRCYVSAFPRGCLHCGLAIVVDVPYPHVDQGALYPLKLLGDLHRKLQPRANRRNSARLPLYLAAG